MLSKQTSYVAKPVDSWGKVVYTEEENATWQELFIRQQDIIQNRVCEEYLQGLKILELSVSKIPQCHEVSEILQATTGWTLEPVAALISFDHFFYLLAHKKFPAATFIRIKEELDYIKEPDIFHEIFGHCPLLTNPAYYDLINIDLLGLIRKNHPCIRFKPKHPC